MRFEKDIFISYAHIDDESLIADEKGWIAEFHRVLEIRLAQLMGQRPKIWRDPSLQGNHIFDKQIVAQFGQVALMISIISPRYVRSEWCVREVNEFYEVCKGNIGFTVGNNARVFKVIKTPVRLDQQPQVLQNILGYEFYNTDSNTGRVREFSSLPGQPTEGLYWDKLNDLVHDIAQFLESLGQVQPSGQSGIAVAGNAAMNAAGMQESKNVFLAESTYDTQEYRDNIKRELQDNGFIIYPDKQLPLVAPLLEENVSNYLSKSTLAIHLIGENYGIIPEGAHKSVIEIQNDLGAAKSAANGIQRLIWIPDTTSPADDRQVTFIDHLNRIREATSGADLIRGSLEDFKNVINDALAAQEEKKRKESEKKLPASNADEHRPIVYLICDVQDLDLIAPVEDYLFSHNIEVVIPVFDGDEAQIREEHIENLKACSAAIIFYGTASEVWLRTKMRDFLKISGYGRSGPLKFKAVFIAGEQTPAKQRFRTLEAEILHGLEGLPEAQINNLLSKL